jgi:hypothetical protein
LVAKAYQENPNLCAKFYFGQEIADEVLEKEDFLGLGGLNFSKLIRKQTN